MRASFVKIPGLIIVLLAFGSICILGARAQTAQGGVQAAPVNGETNKSGEALPLQHGPGSDFIQEGIRITPPVTREKDSHGQPVVWIYNDGGTRRIPIRDAEGRSFEVFIDHKIGTTTPGAIYLNAYPGETNSVRVVHQDEFRQKVGEFDK